MITLFWTVLFCLGLNLVLDEGYVLHWIKKPFLGLSDEIENKSELTRLFPNNKYARGYIGFLKLKLFILKPLILCITCMASIWGITIFITLNGFSKELIPYLILNSFAAAFIQTFIWSFYVRYIQ